MQTTPTSCICCRSDERDVSETAASAHQDCTIYTPANNEEQEQQEFTTRVKYDKAASNNLKVHSTAIHRM